MIIAVVFLLGVIAVLGAYCYKLHTNQAHIISLNTETQQANDQLRQEHESLRASLSAVKSMISDKQDVLNSIDSTIETAKKQVSSVYKHEFERLDDKYQEEKGRIEARKQKLVDELEADYQNRNIELAQAINEQENALNNLRAKQTAYLEAERRKQEIEEQKDYYRLVLSDEDLADIEILRNLQPRFARKEGIDKLIWDAYIKPAYDLLMARLFGNETKKCGIYKITNLDSGIAYIGQSVDIKERFRTHIKTALSYAPSTNKLYQEMKRAGLDHFSFEILEEVPRVQLNEREVYWIDFYQTKEFGLNSQKGGA